MLGAIWAALKAGALALTWWKQKSDQAQGAALLRGEDDKRTLETTQAIHDSLGDPDAIASVHNRARADD